MTCTRPRCNSTPSEHFLHTSQCTLHTPHFTLALCTPHFISSRIMWALLTSSHLISPLLISSHLFSHVIHLSKLFSTVLISSGHWSAFLISSKFISTHLGRSAGQKALNCQREVSCTKKIGRRKLLHTEAWDTDAFTQKSLPKLCATKLAQSTSHDYFVLQRLHTVLLGATLYYKACTKYFPVLLCTTKLAQSTPSTTLYYKARAKHVPVPLCTTELAQSMSQYYFVLPSLHKALPSTTLCYKACTKHFSVLLRTTKLAQSTSQRYSVVQSLRKARPSTTWYYKACTGTTLYYRACTKYFPVLLRTTKLAQSTSQYWPSTTLYYKACTKYFPVSTTLCYKTWRKYFPGLLCTNREASHTEKFLRTEKLSCIQWQQELQLQNRRPPPKRKRNTILKHFSKRIFKGNNRKITSTKIDKSVDK